MLITYVLWRKEQEQGTGRVVVGGRRSRDRVVGRREKEQGQNGRQEGEGAGTE